MAGSEFAQRNLPAFFAGFDVDGFECAPGWGVAGMLVLEVADDLGPVRTLCRSEIATTTDETLVAQLTVTAMRDSPSNLKGIWLSMGVASRRVGGTPTSAPIGGGRDGT